MEQQKLSESPSVTVSLYWLPVNLNLHGDRVLYQCNKKSDLGMEWSRRNCPKSLNVSFFSFLMKNQEEEKIEERITAQMSFKMASTSNAGRHIWALLSSNPREAGDEGGEEEAEQLWKFFWKKQRFPRRPSHGSSSQGPVIRHEMKVPRTSNV